MYVRIKTCTIEKTDSTKQHFLKYQNIDLFIHVIMIIKNFIIREIPIYLALRIDELKKHNLFLISY